MANGIKVSFLKELTERFGKLEKFGESLSLYKIAGSDVQIYIRYSKTHRDGRTWYGLREKDLRLLEGHPSVICFLWDEQPEPLFVPYSQYEDVFLSTAPAGDGQYKVQVIPDYDSTELYIARAGRFNVDGLFGWEQIEKLIDSSGLPKVPDLSHSQVQTLLGSIGVAKGYDIWIPLIDRAKLDWRIAIRFTSRQTLPYGFEKVESILGEIDVMWIQKGANDIRALFEIEHSTPVYSGLLRFNDVHLVAPGLSRFSIVANNERRSLFVRQLDRPTFITSGLRELCTFLDYTDVYNWHQRVFGR
jgi:hypothetical protein